MWYDDPIFDEEVEHVGQHRFVGDAWRRLQELREAGVTCKDVFSVAGTTFRAAAVEAVLKEGVRDVMLEAFEAAVLELSELVKHSLHAGADGVRDLLLQFGIEA